MAPFDLWKPLCKLMVTTSSEAEITSVSAGISTREDREALFGKFGLKRTEEAARRISRVPERTGWLMV